jgi:hypothetical protein
MVVCGSFNVIFGNPTVVCGRYTVFYGSFNVGSSTSIATALTR